MTHNTKYGVFLFLLVGGFATSMHADNESLLNNTYKDYPISLLEVTPNGDENQDECEQKCERNLVHESRANTPNFNSDRVSSSEFASCTPVPGQIDIEGAVYEDPNGNGILNPGETGDSGIEVDIYQDNNSDGMVDGGDFKIATTSTNGLGEYSYTFPPASGSTTDDFSSGNFSAGTGWSIAAWITSGSPEVNGGEARLEYGESIYRTTDLSNASTATLSLDYREASTLEADDRLIIEICSDASFSSCQTLVDVSDDFTSGSISAVAIDVNKLTATSTLRMRLINYEGSFIGILETEYAYMDNVAINYTTPSSGDYVIAINTSTLSSDISLSTGNNETAIFTGVGEKDCDNNFGYTLTDTDGDKVADRNDLDNDNDGILDANECTTSRQIVFSEGFSSAPQTDLAPDGDGSCTDGAGGNPEDAGTYILTDLAGSTLTGGWSNPTGTVDGGVTPPTGVQSPTGNFFIINAFGASGNFCQTVASDLNANGTGGEMVSFDVSDVVPGDYELSAFFAELTGTDPHTASYSFEVMDITHATTLASIPFSNVSNGNQDWQYNSGAFTVITTADLKLTLVQTLNEDVGADIAIDNFCLYKVACPDTDGDGIVNYLDLDSDNDGCPDFVEGGGTFLPSSGLTASGTLSDGNGDLVTSNLGTSVGANGVPTAAGGGQTFGFSNNGSNSAACDIDTDGDGVTDSADIDTDNDGIPDDVEILTATNSGDSDGDGIADQYDLDSDNDGIPDLIEGGGTDTNGDGVVDDACNVSATCDTDGDGLMDSVDADNAAPTGGIAGTKLPITDTDSDGHPDFQDLDADNDGINDIAEAGITDTDHNGVVDQTNPNGTLSADVDGDGFSDSYDPVNNTNAAALGTAAITTDPDANADGLPDDDDADGTAYNGADTDSDGIPDFRDLDSDDDGVMDIVEGGNAAADTDSNGVADNPFVDTDGDGIPDSIDDNISTFGDAGDAGDADDVSDSTDPNSGGSGVVGDSGTDVDGDGIADSVDTDDAKFGNMVESCGSGVLTYAITDGVSNTTGYQWNGTSNVSSTDQYGLTRSTSYCESNNWRHYYNSNEPNKLLFSIEMGANTTEIEYVEIRVAETPESLYDTMATSAIFPMARDWHVKTVADAVLTAPVNVRFYYVPAEQKATLDDAIALAETDGASTSPTVADIVWFKKSTYDPDVDVTANGSNLTGGIGYTQLTSKVMVNTDGESESTGAVNYVQFDGLAGFSGGSSYIMISGAALPVTLTSFTGTSKQCDVELNWSAASEESFSHYEVEWSQDGRNFNTLSKQSASAEQGVAKSYSFKHESETAESYYRLKLVDLDGQFAYSEIIAVQSACSNANLIVFPNPVSKSSAGLTLNYEGASETVEFYVTDMYGRVVKQLNYEVTPMVNTTLSIDISELPTGTYFIGVTDPLVSVAVNKFIVVN